MSIVVFGFPFGIFVHTDAYRYTSDLLILDQCRPYHEKPKVQKRLLGVFTPLRLVQWESLLVSHPDRDYVDYILRGSYQGGFPDWFQGIRVSVFHLQEHAFSDGESTSSVSLYSRRESGVFCWALLRKLKSQRFT